MQSPRAINRYPNGESNNLAIKFCICLWNNLSNCVSNDCELEPRCTDLAWHTSSENLDNYLSVIKISINIITAYDISFPPTHKKQANHFFLLAEQKTTLC